MGDDCSENATSETSPQDQPLEEEEQEQAQVGSYIHIHDMGFLYGL
jgi:hypothetical protein